ncbi:MAG: TonB-dependent receptor plug domain-containing protein, partial [Porticoccus sp.]|nr:TonB-dependent receptor plug domain-containing protein [Porticoccus sp.]
PVAMTVIDRQMIEASGFIEIPDLFRLVPGFQVGLSWRDHHSAVTYHGQSDGLSRRMQVLIDGRVAVGSTFGIIDWDRMGIVIDDIDRIEVVRGPAGVAYGSNAFIGAINIVTREPFANPGWRISTTTGSQDIAVVSSQYAEVGDKFDYRVSASYFHTDGFDRVNDDSTVRSGRFQGRYQFTPGVAVDVQFGQSEGPLGRGGTGVPADPVGSRDDIEEYGSVRVTKSLSPGNEWYVQLGISSTEEDESVNVGLLSELLGVTPSQVPVVTTGLVDQDVFGTVFDISTNQLDLEFQQLLQFGNQHRAVFGLGYRKDTTNNISSIAPGWQASETYRASGNLEFKLSDKVLLNLGALYENNDYSDGKLSYRFGVNAKVAKGHTIRAAVTESWRLLFLGEQNIALALRLQDGTIVDQVQLAPQLISPERLRSYELGYVGAWFRGKVLTEIKVYQEKFENEIEYIFDPTYREPVSAFNPGSILYVGGATTDIVGIETGVKWQFSRHTRLLFSYAFSEVDQNCLAQSFRCSAQNDATPRHTSSVLMSHDYGNGWEGSIGYYFLDDMSWVLWGGDVESYDRVDMRIAKSFQFSGSRLKLELIGQNLGGDYHEFNQNNVFETRTFVRATLQFH